MTRKLSGLALALLVALAAAPSAAAAPVEFDSHSVQLNGKRVFLNGGEVHYFRMPSPREWPDVLAKVRAAGLNMVSIYVPWQLHEPQPGVFRFGGRFDLERFLRDARDQGLYVIVRPGPYIQGEIDGGGYPSWLLGSPGILRTVDPNYTRAWKRWFGAVMPRIRRWELGGSRRGTVIAVQVENEFPGDTQQGFDYMRSLVADAKRLGIRVPITHNDVQFLGVGISPGRYEDIVDMPGFDNYPRGFKCCPEWNTGTFEQIDTFEQHYRDAGYTRGPLYTAEIQGGTTALGADDGKTREERYRAFVGYDPVQTISLLGQGLTVISRYMLFGGTTWGNLVFPGGDGSSYDYAAAIREWDGLGPRYDDLRLTGLQLRAAGGSLAASDRADGRVESTDPAALYAVRRSGVDGALHIFLRNADPAPAKAPALTVDGRRTLPVPLPGHSARWLLAGARLSGWRIDLSTAEVALASGRHLALFGDVGKQYEAVIGGRRIVFTPRSRPRIRRFGRRRLILLSRRDAARLWTARGRIWLGPYLVTQRSIETARRTRVTVIGRRTRRIRLAGPPRRLRLPALARWRFRAETPERQPGYDDSSWRRADHATTHNQMQPNTSPVLGADDYGIVGSGFIWYRGRFDGSASGICLEGRHRYHVWLNGRSLGTYTSPGEIVLPFGYGIGAAPPRSEPVQIAFPSESLRPSGNVVAVLVESWGHAMDAGVANQAKQVRGLVSASLNRPGSPPCGFTLGGETTPPLGSGPPVTLPSAPKPSGGLDWRLRGGDAYAYPNTSGLYGELAGWYRRDYPDRSWRRATLPEALPLGAGEVGWYRTRFRLRISRRVVARLGIRLPAGGHPSEIYVNGVHVARAGRSREENFVIPPGVLRLRGTNTIAIARWKVAGSATMPRPSLTLFETARTRSITRVLRALRRR